MRTNIDLLETEYREKRDKAVSAFTKTMATCDAHENKDADGKVVSKGRAMTAEERAAVQAMTDDAKAANAKLLEAKSGLALATEIEKLTAGMTTSDANETRRAAMQLKSLGRQWVDSEGGQFFLKGQHRGTRQWSSPAPELWEPGMRATTLTEQPGSGQALIVPQYLPGIVPLTFKPLRVKDLLASGTTDSPVIIYMQEQTFTNAAATVTEGNAKPESALVFTQHQENVTKIAHWIPVTEEMLEDVGQISSYIDARLVKGLDLTEEDQLLNGNGTAPNLLGLLNRVGILTVAQGAAPDTGPDAIYRTIIKVYTTSWIMPDGIVMNPVNWQSIALLKDTLGRYLAGGPFISAPSPTLWGLPVAVTPSIAAGTALTGGFSTQAQVFTRGGTRVEATNSHQDFFIKNLVAIRAERREALAVYRPPAFGTTTGLT